MSVVLAILLLEGQPRPEVRLEALAALQHGLLTSDGLPTTLPTFVAVGGLFVLLHLLSPSTRMDTNPEVVNVASQILEQLATEHGDVLLNVLQDCDPLSLLQKLSLDSRCGEVVRGRAASVRKLLGKSSQRSVGPTSLGARQRPESKDRGERLRSAGAALTEGTGYGGGASSRPGLPAPMGSAALHFRTLMDPSSSAEQQQQALDDIFALGERSEGLREIAGCPQMFPALFGALRAAATAVGQATAEFGWKIQLTAFGQVLARGAGSPFRTTLVQNFSDYLSLASSKGGPGPRDAGSFLQGGWPHTPIELRTALAELLSASLVGNARSSSVGPSANLFLTLLESSSPEDLQLVALRSLREALDGEGGGVADEGSPLTPKAANTALLRFIPRQPLLCLDILGALSLRDHFRNFLSTETSLLQFLAHCCHQPAAAAASTTNSKQQPEAVELQRSAARCLANLSAHITVREWARRSSALRGTLAATGDIAVRTYLGVALGTELR